MSTKKAASSPILAPIKSSIDAVIEKAEAQLKPAVEAARAKLQRTVLPSAPAAPPPSPGHTAPNLCWAGPKPAEHLVTSGQSTMKQPVTIEYSSPGLQPPVYIFTNLSQPQWEPVEMEARKSAEGDYHFHKTFSAEDGEYQYKFRLGPGEWWTFDSNRDTVDDGFGNKNNLLVVKPHAAKQTQTSGHAAVSSENREGSAAQTAAAPKVPHEIATSASKDAQDEVEEQADDTWDGADEDEPVEGPLLRHESLSPTSAEQSHSPLFRHETIALGEHKDEPGSVPSSPVAIFRQVNAVSSVPHEADPNDPTLEKFPTDHASIMETIHRTTTQLAADETREHATAALPSAMSEPSDSPVTSLPSVQEDDEELEDLREIEEEQAENEANTVEVDPLKHTNTMMEAECRPSAPMTPPMTPKEEEPLTENEIAITKEEIEGPAEEDRDEQEVEQAVAESMTQAKSFVGVVMEIFSRPTSWVAVLGVAVAVAAGVYKVRYA